MKELGYITLLFLFSLSAHAIPIEPPDIYFDFKKANQSFDQINLKLSVENLNLHDLNHAVDTLTDLDEAAERCVEIVQKKLINLNDFSITNNAATKADKQGVDLVYLNGQKKALIDQQAECHLFSIRAKEAIEAYKSALAQLVQKETLTRDMPLWQTLKQLINQSDSLQPRAWFISLAAEILPPVEILFCCFWLSLLVATVFLIKLNKSRYSRLFLQFKHITLSQILLLTASLSSGCLYLYQLTLDNWHQNIQPPLLIPIVLFCYFLTNLAIVFLFKIRKIRIYFISHALNFEFFRQLALMITSVITLGVIGDLLSKTIPPNVLAWQLMQSLFLVLILCAFVHFTALFCNKHRHFKLIKHHQKLIRNLSVLWVLLCLVIDIEGYQRLAIHITSAGLLNMAIIFITLMVTHAIHTTYLMFYDNPQLHLWVTHYIGYKKDRMFTELFILKNILQVIVLTVSIYLISQTLDFAAYTVDCIYNEILDGVHIASVIIYPVRIISGAVTFCVLFLICRGIATTIIRQHQFEDGEETQVTIASLLTYVGFSIALIIGLIIAGFNFTGLTIIAGALSVGIGLGLQSIVNNFVSGLILLIEKPIRPGDRINVDGAEGFVKKIRVRSTQIITPSREDIIIPNSDLITHRVTNYMFSDKNCQTHCEIGVAYGSDTKLVRDTLLYVANQHDEVVKSGRSKPVVLFKAFGEKNLIFVLSCIIKDVNKKNIVQSDLNFIIEEQFRKHNICIDNTHQSTLKPVVETPTTAHHEKSTDVHEH